MKGTICYIAKDPILKTEKAFSTDFPVNNIEGARRGNIRSEPHQVELAAIENKNEWKLDIHGFCILHHKSHLDLSEIYNDRKSAQSAFWLEIESLIQEHFPQYSRIECFDLTVRRRDSDFPRVIREYQKEYEQPSQIPHCDWSKDGSMIALRWSFPGNEDFWPGKSFDMLNVWRPLKQPSDDWPLAMCDFTTIDQDHDILDNDAIRRSRVDENSLLHFNENHKWYYIKDQGVDDLLVFRNADSSGEKSRAFHVAVQNPMAEGPPRESVEVRLVAIH